MAQPTFNKTIWMLWLQGVDDAPELVRRCIESWQYQNPGWTVSVLSKKDVDALWDTDVERTVAEKMPESALADLARMKLLLRSGGIWADATLACQVPLDNWLQFFFGGGFFAFHEPPVARPLDNYFLAAGAGNFIVQRWYETSLRLWSKPSIKSRDGVDQCGRYTRRLHEEGKPWLQQSFWQDIEHIPYYWPHYLFDYLLLGDKNVAAHWAKMPKCNARVTLTMEASGFVTGEREDREAFLELLHHNMAPVHKLNWRRMDLEKSENLRLLLDHCCRVPAR